MHGLCDRAGRLIRIDVIGIKGVIQPDRCDDRQEILIKQVFNDLGIHFLDLTDKPDVFAVCVLLFNL